MDALDRSARHGVAFHGSRLEDVRPLNDAKSTLALCLICIALTSLALAGLAHGNTAGTLSALERIPVHTSDADESPENRQKRLRNVAAAIDAATADLDERAWLIMTAQRESGLAAYVTEDQPRCSEGHGGRCDGGRAFGPWQLHRMRRVETLTEQATEAVRRVTSMARYCSKQGQPYWLGGIAGYATGMGCQWSEAAERVKSMRLVRARL